MKTASDALKSYLAAVRSGDQPLIYADLFTFSLQNGQVLQYSTADIAVTVDGTNYNARSVLVSGLRYKATIGLNVDQQQISIDADEGDEIAAGVPFMVGLRRGLFDGASLQRDRAFFTAWNLPAVGSVTLFKGVVATADSIGRTKATLTVNSDLIYLDINLPRNTYQTTCLHTLYDSGCSLAASAFSAPGVVEAGSTKIAIVWSGADAIYLQGRIVFMSGPNSGSSASVRNITGSVLLLSVALPDTPSAGDAFTIYQGCDHTQATCTSKFSNLANFRGFPYVPRMQTAI